MASKKAAPVTEKLHSLKLLVDSKARRVLFAEAEKELVDFLFSLLAVPLGSIIELVTKENMVGSLANLYESVEKMSATYLQPNLDRNLLLKPKSILSVGNFRLLPSSIGGEGSNFNKFAFGYVPNFQETVCPSCNRTMPKEASAPSFGGISFSNPSASPFGCSRTSNASSTDVDGYVKGLVTYMVTDELEVMPMSTISSVTMLKKYNVLDVGCLEEKIVDFGIQEALEVLKATLRSKTVLTDVFLQKKPKLETPYHL